MVEPQGRRRFTLNSEKLWSLLGSPGWHISAVLRGVTELDWQTRGGWFHLKGRSRRTVDQFFILDILDWIIFKGVCEVTQPVLRCFGNLKKAFDQVPQDIV